MAVDWNTHRTSIAFPSRAGLAKAQALLAKSEMGALLCFDMNNVRYLTPTHIGTWAQEQGQPILPCCRRTASPFFGFRIGCQTSSFELPVARPSARVWNFYAARRDDSRDGRAEDVAKKIRIELEMRGLH